MADAESETLEGIFTRYENAMFRVAFSVLGDEWAAEDAVMDAMTKLCAWEERFKDIPEYNRRLLVLRYTENAAKDRRRKRGRIEAVEGPEDPEPGFEPADGDGSAEDAFFARESWTAADFGRLAGIVDALSEKYREVVTLRFGEEFDNREIAAMLGIPASTVATRISRAKDLIRKRWKESAK